MYRSANKICFGHMGILIEIWSSDLLPYTVQMVYPFYMYLTGNIRPNWVGWIVRWFWETSINIQQNILVVEFKHKSKWSRPKWMQIVHMVQIYYSRYQAYFKIKWERRNLRMFNAPRNWVWRRGACTRLLMSRRTKLRAVVSTATSSRIETRR